MRPTPNLYRYEFKGWAGKCNEIYHRCTPNPSISQMQSHHNPWQCSTLLRQADQTTSRRSQKGIHRSTPTHDYGQYPLLRSILLQMGWTSAWGSSVRLLSEWTPSGPLDSHSFLRRSWRTQCLRNTGSIWCLRLCPSMFPSRVDTQASQLWFPCSLWCLRWHWGHLSGKLGRPKNKTIAFNPSLLIWTRLTYCRPQNWYWLFQGSSLTYQTFGCVSRMSWMQRGNKSSSCCLIQS